MTTGCTFAAECERRYTANLMRMLTYHFTSKTTFRNIDYVFIICLVFQYYSIAKGSIKMQLSLKQKTEKILNINWSNNLRGYFCSSPLVKFLCLDHRFYSRFFFQRRFFFFMHDLGKEVIIKDTKYSTQMKDDHFPSI